MDDPFANTDHSTDPFDAADFRKSRAVFQWLIEVYPTVQTLHSAGKASKLLIKVGIPTLGAAVAFGYYIARSGWTP